MSILEIALDRSGLAVFSVSIGVDHARREAMLKAGHSVPPDYTAPAIVDTGCNGLVIASSIINRLGLHPHGATQTTTATGLAFAPLFDVRIQFLWGADIFQYEGLARSYPLDGGVDIGVLLGADVFKDSQLVFDYPARTFRAQRPDVV